MLDTDTKKRINDCRDILVGKLPDPKAQIEQITIALIYKFMDDMDKEAIALGGKAAFFADFSMPDPQDPQKNIMVEFSQYSWDALFDSKVTAADMLKRYAAALETMEKNPNIPQLFRDIFRNAYLPYRDPETLKMFLKTISGFTYTHSEKLGDAFEFLLSIMGSQGDAGQFRTPRHIIDFMVEIVDPQKNDSIFDPACGTAGFLVSAFKHVKNANHNKLTPDEQRRLLQNVKGFDISPDMVRLSLVNLYLHGFASPQILEYDSLTDEKYWQESYDVILANPPFMSPKGGIRPHGKFSISSSRSEVLFVDYIAEHLAPQGRAAIIVPEGVIFQSGKAYKELRKMLVQHYLYAVVSLPAGVFNPYSGVKTSILLMDKQLAKSSDDILFVKIDNDGFSLGAQRNPVKGSQLPDAIQAIADFRAQHNNETPLAHAVAKSEIAKNGEYNLSGERYKNSQNIDQIKFDVVSIGEIFTTCSGGTPLKNKVEYYKDGNIPWLRSGEVAQGYITSSELYISEQGLKNSSAKVFPINTVLIAMYGATAGQVGLLKFKAATNQAICGILPNTKALPEYLYLILKSQKDYLISLSGGGAQPNISQKIIRDLKIPLPPLSFQEEIVAEIEGYQKIIDGAKAVVSTYKPKIDIDPEWEMVELGEVCHNIQIGPFGTQLHKSDYVKNGIPIINPKHIQEMQFFPSESISIEKANSLPQYFLKTGDIIMGRRGEMGRLAYVSNAQNGWFCGTGSLIIRLNKEENSKFFSFILASNSTIEFLITNSRGVTMLNLNKDIINRIPVPKIPLDTQNQIVAQIEKEQELVNANKQLIEIFEQKIKDRIANVWGEA